MDDHHLETLFFLVFGGKFLHQHDQKQNQVSSVQREFFLFKWAKITINLREK
jgi:G:T-mismatch repair DNA endonuclease (very short patch repair protein)